ncbi:Major facilitator superfamily protein [Trifolium repens]|nr:Major facilitator superfamily protein [Trifolium repens]
MHSSSLSTMIPTTSWFTPKRLLTIFCVINLLNYLDQGTIASNGVNGSRGTCTEGAAATCTSGSGIQGDFNLNNFEDGILSSAFMVGLLVACPIFASLAKSVNPFRLIGVGSSIWTLATLFCGFSFNLWSISVCRMLVGVGEASFISLAAPFIDDNAPASLVGSHFGWRYAFWIEAILMLPFAILGFLMKPLHLKGFFPADLITAQVPETVSLGIQATNASIGKGESLSLKAKFKDKSSNDQSKSKSATKMFDQVLSFLVDMKEIHLDKVYVINVLVGTLAGGFALDFMTNTLSNAFKLLSVTTFLGAAFCFGAFLCRNVNGFLILFSIGELLVFATQPSLRPLSMAMSTVAIHVFGDVPSSPLVGILEDSINSWRTTTLILTTVLFPAAGIWFIGWIARTYVGNWLLLSENAVALDGYEDFRLVERRRGPVNYVCLHCVKPSLRPLSMAMSTVAIHVFGDVPSSPLVGILEDSINSWRTTTLILTTVLFPAAGIWFIGIFVHSVDKFEDDNEHQVCTIPFLQEKTGETSASHTRSQEC